MHYDGSKILMWNIEKLRVGLYSLRMRLYGPIFEMVQYSHWLSLCTNFDMWSTGNRVANSIGMPNLCAHNSMHAVFCITPIVGSSIDSARVVWLTTL